MLLVKVHPEKITRLLLDDEVSTMMRGSNPPPTKTPLLWFSKVVDVTIVEPARSNRADAADVSLFA